MSRPLSQQVIVIVGASSGMGLCAAEEAARRGAKVVLAARNERDLNAAVERIRRAGGEALAVPTDVTVYEQVESLARQAVDEFGRIDTWVNNAAVSMYATFKESSLEDFRRIVETNFFGVVHGTKAALPHLEATEGTLICVGSTLSDRGVPLQGAYCGAKHAIKGWLDSLRVELMKEGSKVRITLIKPSSIDTPLFNKAKTQMGVMPQPIPPIYRPELAAEAILWAAEHPKRDLFVGGAGKGLSVAERINSRIVDFQQLYQGFDSQKSEWPKSVDAPNNLYGPVAGDGGARGDFSDRAKSRSLYHALATRPRGTLVATALVGVAAIALGRRQSVGYAALGAATATLLLKR
jgi:NAD(P)-dependent dehydrogenase (short-subunit alcohol dehydrogenase family)